MKGVLFDSNVVLTRDPKGFRHSPVRSVTPEALLPILSLEA